MTAMTPEDRASLLHACSLMAPAGDKTTSMFNGTPIWPVVRAAMAYAGMSAAPAPAEIEAMEHNIERAKKIAAKLVEPTRWFASSGSTCADDALTDRSPFEAAVMLTVVARHLETLVSLARRAQAGGGAVPSGWKLVPIEPTQEMWSAWRSINCAIGTDGMEEFTSFEGDYGNWVANYQAMLSASPAEPSQEGWQPIATAPKTSVDFTGGTLDFLAWCPDETARNGGDIRVCWWEPKMGPGERGCWFGDSDIPLHPTLWRPLPPAPLSTEGGER